MFTIFDMLLCHALWPLSMVASVRIISRAYVLVNERKQD
jgi:hypothetical protein